MLSKACKSVIVVVFLFFLVNVDVSAQMGIVDIDMGRYSQGGGVTSINVDLVKKNTNKIIIATLFDERGNAVDLVKLNNSFSSKVKWRVESGFYKVLLVNAKTGEREVHYVNL